MTDYHRDLAKAHKAEPYLDKVYKNLNLNFVRFADDTPEQINDDTDGYFVINNKKILFEEKNVKAKYPSIYIETVSNSKTGKPGWLYTSKANILVWNFENKEILFFDFNKLKEIYKENWHKYTDHQNQTYNATQGKLMPLQDTKPALIKTVILA